MELQLGRQTVQKIRVMRFLLHRHNEGREAYGLQIIRTLQMKGGVVYPILHGFEEAGATTSRVEPQESNPRAPGRRLYRLTEQGVRDGREFVEF